MLLKASAFLIFNVFYIQLIVPNPLNSYKNPNLGMPYTVPLILK